MDIGGFLNHYKWVCIYFLFIFYLIVVLLNIFYYFLLLIGFFFEKKIKNVTPNSSPSTPSLSLVICLIKLAIVHNYYQIQMCNGEWWVWLAIGKWLFKKVNGLAVKMMKGWREYGIEYKCGEPLFAMVVFSLFKNWVFFFQTCNGA